MGLEAFDFIPDLVATNPEPTDPVAQGDDHLRGIKFTLQNQFPVIGEDAVTLTALQMNDAALQSEDNTFSGVNTFSGANIFTIQQTFQQDIIRTVQGANESGLYFCNSETSFRRWAFGRENTNTSGDWILQRRDAAGAIQDKPIQVSQGSGSVLLSASLRGFDGTAAAPGYAFLGDSNMGMFRVGTDVVGFATAGASRFTIGVTNVGFTIPIRSPDGSATAPAYTFTSGSNVGMFRPSVNVIGFSTAGVERATITNAGIRSTLAGAETAPAYSFSADTDTGMFASTGTLGFTAGGVQFMAANATQQTLSASAIVLSNLPTTNPGGTNRLWKSSGFVAIT